MLPTLADFFLGCLYVLIGSCVLSVSIIVIGGGVTEVRKRWSK